MKEPCYFDNAATTKVLKTASEVALNCMNLQFGNPSSLHKFGIDAEQIIDNTRETVASILSCHTDEIFFTPSATISTNIALFGGLKIKRLKKINRTKIISSQIEHSATKNSLNELEKLGFEIIKINPRNKIYYAEDFLNEIDDSTCLITLMHVNNENGLILPVEEIATQAKMKNPDVLVHLDCAQSFTKLPINLIQIPADFVSISGHKINAPKGIGCLFVRQNTKIKPIFFGGDQEEKICPGTQNVPAIAGLNVAAKFHFKNMAEHNHHFQNLKNALISQLEQFDYVKLNFEKNCSAPHIVNISIGKVPAQVMLNFLNSKGFFVSNSSACLKGRSSNVLVSLGYGKQRQDSAIRISFSFDNTLDEISRLVKAIEEGFETIIT